MQPRYLFTTWTTNDLTDAKLCIVDGRLVVLVPKKWEEHLISGPDGKGAQQSTIAVNFEGVDIKEGKKPDGSLREFKVYRITEWETIDLAEYMKGKI